MIMAPERKIIWSLINDLLEVSRKKHPNAKIDKPMVNFNCRGKKAGVCQYTKGVIGFNGKLWDHVPHDRVYEEVIPHELAHWVALAVHGPGAGHGPKWVDIMVNDYGIVDPQQYFHGASPGASSGRKSVKKPVGCPQCGRQTAVSPRQYNMIANGSKPRYCTRCKCEVRPL